MGKMFVSDMCCLVVMCQPLAVSLSSICIEDTLKQGLRNICCHLGQALTGERGPLFILFFCILERCVQMACDKAVVGLYN